MSAFLFNRKVLGLLSAISLSAGLSYGQTLSGSYTIGAGGNYPNLTGPTGLFNAINTNGLSGDVSVLIISDITEPATDSLKDYTLAGTNNYRLTIKPDAAILRNLTSTATGFMMTFYGTRNITIDGSFAGSGNYLRISNDNSSNNAGSIKFLNGCITDTVANCILESSSASTAPANNTQKAATVLLDASITGAASNGNIVFASNIFRNITGAANFPPSHLRAIDATAAVENNAIKVLGNQFVNSRIESIRTGTNTSSNTQLGWTITGNSIYANTNTGTPATTTKVGMQLTRSMGHVVNNNYIGGNNVGATGTYISTSPFTAISMSISSFPSVNNNTISNISVALSSPSATGGGLVGIAMGSLSGSVTNNVIRNLTTNGCNVMAINVTGSTDTVRFNTIRNLTSTFNNTTGVAQRNALGIAISGGNSYHYLAGNIIDSISGSSGYYQYATAPTGIYVGSIGGGATVIENNNITNIGNLNNTASSFHSASVSGITIAANVTTQPLFVNRNYIANIYGVNTSANGNNITGIMDFSASSSTAVCTNTYTNNVIILGSNAANIPNTAWLTGIEIGATLGATFNFNNNTISIPASISLNSMVDSANRGGASCIARLNNAPIMNLQNNVLSNLAQNAPTATGAMVAVNYMTDASGGTITSDYNVYNSLNTNTVIADAGTGYSLSGWRALKSIDGMTTVGAVLFTSNTDLHINTTNPAAWNAFGRGIADASVPTDKDGNVRSTTVGIPTTPGAYEIATPSSVPVDMIMLPATPVVGTPTEFWSNGRKIAEINWVAGGTLPSSLSAKFYPGVAAPFLDYSPKTNAYFEINETGFAGSYTIKQYVNIAEGAGQSFSSLRAAKRHNTDPYTFIANAGSNNTDVNGNYLQSTPQTTFSTFGMTSGTTPLAIRLKDIKAFNFGADNKVSWTTAAESNEDVFELQSAADGKSFRKIATIKASGTPGGYDYWNRNAAKGLTYYRLKLNAANGMAEYSNIVTAVVSQNNGNITVSPNPASDFITIRNDQKSNGTLHIELADISGRIVKSVNTTETDTIIDLKSLPAGTYIIRVTEGQTSFVAKVIKN